MRNRCNNPKAVNYANYGGRGITVCAEWDSFEVFLKDMGRKPSDTTLERIDNNLGYCKANCKWATVAEQNLNQRTRTDNKLQAKNIRELKGMFQVRIKSVSIGVFSTLEAAIIARDNHKAANGIPQTF